MGTKKELKLYFLILLFLLTSIIAFRSLGTATVVHKPAMKDYFGEIPGYTTLQHIPLAESAVEMLNLDDYFYTAYLGPNGKVNLYIGYYYSANKAYAAHSPLICYPSQGWEIKKQPVAHELKVGSHVIHYEEIVTSFGTSKELVLYWYQAYKETNIQIYKNKIDIGYNKFRYNNEQHAFVRVSVPFNGASREEVHQVALDFMQVFYPQFLSFFAEGSVGID